jgi:hypothetical protein
VATPTVTSRSAEGAHVLTGPTFGPGGSAYTTPVYTLHKSLGPAVAPDTIGHIDAALLSHEHHFDNLDHAGRSVMSRAGAVITTPGGARAVAHARDIDADHDVNLESW